MPSIQFTTPSGSSGQLDITAERKQTNYKRIADNLSESSWRVELRNAKDETVTVRVQEPMPGDWEMIQLLFDAPDATAALEVGPELVAYAQHEGADARSLCEAQIAAFEALP